MNARFPILFVLLLATGCTTQRATTTTTRTPIADSAPSVSTITNTDQCAMRLHDICGALLLYYSANHHLPDDVVQLRNLPGGAVDPSIEFVCPVSQQPYVYNSGGIRSPVEGAGLVVLYDATPAHAGHRWCISIIEPSDPNGPLITKVIAVKEDAFIRAMEGRVR